MEAIQVAISQYAYLSAFIIFIVLVTYGLIKIELSEHQELISVETLLNIVNAALIAVAIVITSIPEGIPLTVSISAVFSVDKMKKDNLLIKKLEALESAGKLTDVLTGKTGTLTKANLKVEKFWCAGQ